MTQGGSGFTQGDDFVAARVSIDVPAEGIQSLRELSMGIDQARTSMEQSARSATSYLGYVQQITQAANMAAEAHRGLAAQLERTADLQQRAMGSGMPGQAGAQSALPLSRAAPQGYVDPWAGMGVGMGSQRVPTTPQNVHPGNDTGMQESVVEPTRQLDPRKYINAQAGRHRVLPSDFQSPSEMTPVDLDSVAGRVEQRDRVQRQQQSATTHAKAAGAGMNWDGQVGGLVNNIMNELRPGGNYMSTLGMLQRGMGAMGRVAGAGPGASGVATAAAANAGDAITAEGMFAGLGRMAGPLGIGLAGLGAVEKGGAMYQGYKNLGSIRGGGAAEGFGTEMQIRAMALNPFLSTEQSRQIVMAGLTEGYSGKTFDTVTQFMASNLKDMNMAQPHTASVLTPTGWAKMGELAVGDQVIAGDGTTTTVTGVYDRGLDDVYEVVFTDGTSTRCTLDHLWLVYQTNERAPRVMFLKDMLAQRRKNSEGLLRKNGDSRYRVPLVKPVQFGERALPVDPYTLGVLIGDGSFGYGHISVHCYEEELYPLVLPVGVAPVRQGDSGEYRLTGNWNRWNPNPLRVALNELGLRGLTTKNKFIPADYLMGSVAQRFALLQGLIDTDGHIDKNGIVFFTNTSAQLINDVRELVLSLGGQVTNREIQPKQNAKKNGQAINSGLAYRMQIRLPGDLGAPCRLARKAQRYVSRMATDRKRTKNIVSATFVGREDCRCIAVEHPDHLYVTDDYTVTHNTVSESVSLLRKNVVEGGQSIAGLATSLGVIKEMSKSGVMSMPDILSSVEATSASGVNAGMSGGQATELGMINSQVWNDPSTRALKGTFGPLADSIMNNPAGGAAMRVFGGVNVPGLPPDQIRAYLSNHGGAPAIAKATNQMIGNLVKRVFSSPASRDKNSVAYLRAMSIFMRMLQQYAPGSPPAQDENIAMQMVDQYLSGANPVADAQKRVSDATQKVTPTGGSNLQAALGMGSNWGEAFGAIGRGATDLFKGAVGWATGNEEADNNARLDFGKTFDNLSYHTGQEATNPVLSKIVDMYGASSVELVGKDGKAQALNGSRAQVEAFAHGDLNWRRKGESGPGLSAAQTLPSGGRVDDGRNGAPGGQTNVNFSPAQVSIRFDDSGRPTATPNPVQLTPNQQSAMSGAGGTMNNPPPGDGYGYWPGRSLGLH